MGLFWDILQQSQISENQHKTGNLESRVERLERELQHARETIRSLVTVLENHFGQDIDHNGQIG